MVFDSGCNPFCGPNVNNGNEGRKLESIGWLEWYSIVGTNLSIDKQSIE